MSTANPSELWPPYFQPQPGNEDVPATEPLRLPTHVVDLFYLRESPETRGELVAVLRCLGGELAVAWGEALHALPSDIKTQLNALQVGQRNQFRAIIARELFVFTLDAVAQPIQHVGFNDPVQCLGHMWDYLAFSIDELRATPLSNVGRLTVGRLDCLHAYRVGLAQALTQYTPSPNTIYHLLLPATPVNEIRQGRGLVLVYPLLDPQIDQTDNTIIILRLAYDLLVQLQQDMVHAGGQHPFTSISLPVPSRRRLEAELASDGYQIQGNEAIKRNNTQVDTVQERTFLDQLRQLAEQWTAPRIALPPQATPQDYSTLIDQALSIIATHEDKAMLDALSSRVETRLSPAEGPASGRSSPSSSLAVRPKPSQPSPEVSPPQRRSRPRSSITRQRDWSRDFASTPARPQQRGTDTREWETDFAAASSKGEHAQRVTSPSDWLADFEAERDTELGRSLADRAKEVKERATNATRRSDIEAAHSATPGQDWEDDFA